MSVHIIKVPDLGEGIAEVELVAWHVAPGEEVVEDQPLADVMTDKANVEIPSPVAGRVVSLGSEPGQVMAVGADLILIEAGEANGESPVQANPPESARAAGSIPADTLSQGHKHVAAGAELAPQALHTPDVPDTPHAAQAPDAVEAMGAPGRGAGRAGLSTPERPSASPSQGAPVLSEQVAPLASPAVRRHAREVGIELRAVLGTGPGGRVLHQDLDVLSAPAANQRTRVELPDRVRPGGGRQAHALPPDIARHGAASPGIASAGVQASPLTGLRRRIAQRMQDSLRIPHFTYVEEVDVTEAEKLRAELNERFAVERDHLTLLALLVRAVTIALRKYPEMNARFDDDAGVVTQFTAVHMGIATHTPAGLVVPVVRDVQAKNVWSAATDIAEVAAAARQGKATREQLSGSTITITSLGALGGIMSTPVINLPEVAIIGVNRIVERPVFRDGVVVPRKMMNLSSSFDHRVIDGMPAAQFVQEIRSVLECPALLFIE